MSTKTKREKAERKERAASGESSLSKEECDLVVRLTYCGGVEAGMTNDKIDGLCKKLKLFLYTKS